MEVSVIQCVLVLTSILKSNGFLIAFHIPSIGDFEKVYPDKT